MDGDLIGGGVDRFRLRSEQQNGRRHSCRRPFLSSAPSDSTNLAVREREVAHLFTVFGELDSQRQIIAVHHAAIACRLALSVIVFTSGPWALACKATFG